MQCPLSSCCCMSPKVIFMTISILGFGLGILSAFGPKRSIGLYQWMMERFNWKVAPIDELREIRNTCILGIFLTLLSLAILTVVLCRF